MLKKKCNCIISNKNIKSINNSLKNLSSINLELVNNKSEIISMNTKVKFKCNLCNHERITSLNCLKKYKNCKYCHWSKENIYKILKNCSSNLKLLTPFENIKHGQDYNTEFECLDCNHKFKTCLGTIQKRDTGCPNCNSSRGERIINNLLNEYENLIFEREFKFPVGECDFKRPLPFDFAININNKFCLIEFDGRQHFEPMTFRKNGNPY